jgi:hypothetical protein
MGAPPTELPMLTVKLSTDVENTAEENKGYVVFKINFHGLAWTAGGGQG